MSAAPVLIKLDYDAAKLLDRLDPSPRPSDHGLVIVGVDSCQNGAGWILYQMVQKEKHPVIFGSCTFSPTEASYSQPKLELYGVFRAIKDLWHRIWGIHFQIDVDAKFLIEMVKQPDLPNVPMTCWISYIALFDYVMHHVPSQSHTAEDGLSRQRRTSEDSDDEDAEEYLDRFMGSAHPTLSSFSLFQFANSLSSESLYNFRPLPLDQNFLKDLLFTMHRTPRTPYASFSTSMSANVVFFLSTSEPSPSMQEEIRKMKSVSFDPSVRDLSKGSLTKYSLLLITDDFLYTGREFEFRKVCIPEVVNCLWEGEERSFEVFSYKRTFMSTLKQGAFPPSVTDNFAALGPSEATSQRDNRIDYEDVSPQIEVTCAVHAYGVKDKDSLEMWSEIILYLKDDTMPARCEDAAQRKSFIRQTKNFFLHNGEKLWKFGHKGKLPRLVIVNVDRRSALIAEAHNNVGHRGRDATYKTLSERYYWPNLYDQVAYFVHSCNICQLHSKLRPIVAFNPTRSTGILRRFDLDTIHMPDSINGHKFLLQATDPAISWVEARSVAKNSSENWAKFLYEVYSRFGCVLLCLVDSGKEFRGAVEILFKQYGIVVVTSTPYHPQGNGHAERSHQTLSNSILRACGKDTFRWPLYVHAGLWAMRCSTSRVTGYTPYFLLYGQHPFFAFDFTDRTWETLDWHKVASTEDLLALRMQQILCRDKKLVLAMEEQKRSRQQPVDDFNSKHERYLSSGEFILGTWVLLHETWLDSQMGNKGALRWTGPYIVHHKLHDTTYQLRELDGTVIRASVAANCLKIFYYREEHQMVRTVGQSEYSLHIAATSSTLAHASTLIGTLNQARLTTPPYPVSIKHGEATLPDNLTLSFAPAFTVHNVDDSHIHHLTLPMIRELQPTKNMYISDVQSAVMPLRYIESSNISELQTWALETLLLR